jgi:hypothetical protein
VTGRLLSAVAVLLLFAGAYVVALNMTGEGRFSGPKDSSQDAGAGGPQIVLRGVEMVEMRREGQVYRLLSDNASYSIRVGHASASNVTLVLKEREGDVVVTAPVASWDMDEGRIDLPRGASARDGSGWSAVFPGAVVDLDAEVITAEDARFEGPGLTVAGRNLRWRWQDGTVALDSPRSSILPVRVRAPERKG